MKVWNVMNVKTSCKGKHKRNYTMNPIRSAQDWKLASLTEIANFLIGGKSPRNLVYHVKLSWLCDRHVLHCETVHST